MNDEMKKKRDELADEYVSWGYGCDGDTSKDSYSKGFDACYELMQVKLDIAEKGFEIIANSNHGKDCDLLADKVAKLALETIREGKG